MEPLLSLGSRTRGMRLGVMICHLNMGPPMGQKVGVFVFPTFDRLDDSVKMISPNKNAMILTL